MAGGRPTKYKKKYCDELVEYFDQPPQEILYKRTYFMNGQVKSEEPITDRPRELPTFQGFAHEIGVDITTLERWAAKHKEFCRAYARAKQIQENIWLQESMTGRYNAQFAKFFGVNCLGYKDKVEQETVITDYSLRFDDMTQEDSDEICG